MHKSLLLSANNSIAFDASVVERLNNKAAQIDSRLYLFAYYQPKTLPKDIDSRGCFILTILNMYGLLWDCGKIVRYKLLKYKFDNLSSEANSNLKSCQDLVIIISTIRACLCHNNSNSFFYNCASSDACSQYLCNITGVKDSNSIPLSVYGEPQWDIVCKDLLDRCNQFTNTLNHILDRTIKEPNPIKKNTLVQYWINSICEWYRNDPSIIDNILADYCNLKHKISNTKNKSVTKKDVILWIGNRWRGKDRTLVRSTPKDYYEDYVKVCLERLPTILKRVNGHTCPNPALPVAVIKEATADAMRFNL